MIVYYFNDCLVWGGTYVICFIIPNFNPLSLEPFYQDYEYLYCELQLTKNYHKYKKIFSNSILAYFLDNLIYSIVDSSKFDTLLFKGHQHPAILAGKTRYQRDNFVNRVILNPKCSVIYR